MRGADLIVKAFEAAGVTYGFSVVGSTVAAICDAIDGSPRMKYIPVRHEQVGASMADAYARLTRRPAVALGHAAPGSSNLIIGVVTAYRDSSPMIVISGNETTHEIGKDAWQEFDALGVFKPITKWSTRIERTEDIAYVIRNALIKSVSGRPGPVHIDIPRDVAEGEVDEDQLLKIKTIANGPLMTPYVRPAPGREAVDAACDLLVRAQRPAILVGGGVLFSGAEAELRALAELLEAPVAASQTSRGAIPEDHPLGLGVSGQNGNRFAEQAVAEADVVLAIGSRLSDLQTKHWTLLDDRAKLIHVDIDANEMGRNYTPTIPIVADAKATLEAIFDELRSRNAKPAAGASSRCAGLKQGWQQDLDSYFNVQARDAIPAPLIARTVMLQRKRDAIFTYGAGGNTAHANRVPILEPRTHLKAIGSAAMGFGFPAALGAKLAYPERQVVCMLGDGDFLMTCQDLETAVRLGLDPTVIIFNNMGLGFARPHGNPDFVKFAESFGAAGARAQTPAELEQAFAKLSAGGRVAIIDAVQERPQSQQS